MRKKKEKPSGKGALEGKKRSKNIIAKLLYDKNGELSRLACVLVCLSMAHAYAAAYILLYSWIYSTPITGWLWMSPAITAGNALIIAWRKILRVRRALPPKRYGVLPPETICEIMRGTEKLEKKTYEK